MKRAQKDSQFAAAKLAIKSEVVVVFGRLSSIKLEPDILSDMSFTPIASLFKFLVV